MSELKPYAPPQIFEVPLKQEQAVLTLCSVGHTSTSGNTGTGKCVHSTLCKKGAGTADNGAPAS